MSFAADIANFADKAKLSHDQAVVAVCSKLTSLVIAKTPVDSGRARGNYYATIDSYSNEQSETRTESEALSSGLNTAKQASGKLFTLTNNLPYITKLEYGSSKQAPAGMVRTSLGEIANALKRN